MEYNEVKQIYIKGKETQFNYTFIITLYDHAYDIYVCIRIDEANVLFSGYDGVTVKGKDN